MDNVLNELSLSGWCDHHEAEVGLESLCSLLLALAERGCAPVLRTPKSFWSQALYDGYTVGQWLRIAGGGKRRDNARLVASWASKSPFVDDLLRKAEGQRGAIEGRCSGALALGATLAAVRELPLVSLTTPGWSADTIAIEVSRLSDDLLTRELLTATNFTLASSVQRRSKWLSDRLRRDVESGHAFLRSAATLVPHLSFARDAEKQIRELRGSEQVFASVMKHLFALEMRAREWSDGPFEVGYEYPCSQESESTLAAHGDLRTFLCPDGEFRVFSWHSKIAVQAWRIHFIADGLARPRRVIIGYVGPHLDTATG
jgi:hypothetical protein